MVSASLWVACANQTDVIPMLHVEPNAGPRILYFEKRARALYAEKDAAPPAELAETEQADAAAHEGQAPLGELDATSPEAVAEDASANGGTARDGH